MAGVTIDQCDERNGKTHERIDEISDTVSQIKGGIIVAAFVIVIFITGVFYHINYRFSNVESTLKTIQQTLRTKSK